jgi:hypothetical protein
MGGPHDFPRMQRRRQRANGADGQSCSGPAKRGWSGATRPNDCTRASLKINPMAPRLKCPIDPKRGSGHVLKPQGRLHTESVANVTGQFRFVEGVKVQVVDAFAEQFIT